MRSQNSRTRWNAPPGGAVEDTPGLGEAPLMGIIGRRADYKTFRMLLQNGGLPGPLRLVLALVQILSRERAAKLHRSEEHTSELQSRLHLVCRLLLETK